MHTSGSFFGPGEPDTPAHDQFYTTLAEHYSAIFPPGEAQKSFLAGLLGAAGPGPFLDVACGTGAYVLAVALSGRRCVGVDLSPAMISHANLELRRAKEREPGIEAAFAVGDMRSLPGLADGDFAAAACIGNSLPHLLTSEDLHKCLGELVRVVRPGGLLVIQTVNYDGLTLSAPGERVSLPPIKRDTPALLFERQYVRRPDGLLDFVVRLQVEDAPQPGLPSRGYTRSTVLRPWLRGDLESHLRRVGFDEIVAYGAFALRPHRSDAPALVLVATRAIQAKA
jgi:SAM-dependent methyltransferase